mgnify:CR=1 FL=1
MSPLEEIQKFYDAGLLWSAKELSKETLALEGCCYTNYTKGIGEVPPDFVRICADLPQTALMEVERACLIALEDNFLKYDVFGWRPLFLQLNMTGVQILEGYDLLRKWVAVVWEDEPELQDRILKHLQSDLSSLPKPCP